MISIIYRKTKIYDAFVLISLYTCYVYVTYLIGKYANESSSFDVRVSGRRSRAVAVVDVQRTLA